MTGNIIGTFSLQVDFQWFSEMFRQAELKSRQLSFPRSRGGPFHPLWTARDWAAVGTVRTGVWRIGSAVQAQGQFGSTGGPWRRASSRSRGGAGLNWHLPLIQVTRAAAVTAAGGRESETGCCLCCQHSSWGIWWAAFRDDLTRWICHNSPKKNSSHC